MKRSLPLLVAVVLGLPGCATIQSVLTPSPPPGPAPPSRVEPPPLPPLQPQLTEVEERRLRDQATRQIAEAERTVQAVRTERLQPAERETYTAIQGFLRQAQDALASRDYQRATNLAQKAQTLAQDLPRAPR